MHRLKTSNKSCGGIFFRLKQSILVLVAAAAEAFTCVVAVVVVYLFVQILLLLLLLGFLHVIVQFPYSCHLTFLYSIKSQSKRGPLLLVYVIHLLILVCELINQLSLASSTLEGDGGGVLCAIL